MLLHRQPDLTLVMENVNKPHNLSAIIRSCDATGIHDIQAISRRKSIFAHQSAAAGASRWTTLTLWKTLPPLFEQLKTEGKQILVAHNAPGSIDFRSIDYTKPTAIVMGAELDGPSTQAVALADKAISIPMHGMVESLNVSVAAAVILFEIERQRKENAQYERLHLEPARFRNLLFELSYPRLSEQLQEKGLPYPELDEDGSIVLEEQ